MSLENLRKEIDEVDDEIISFLAKRTELIKEIAKVKKESGKEALDEERETQLLENLKKKAKELGVNEELVLKIYKEILKDSVKSQEEII